MWHYNNLVSSIFFLYPLICRIRSTFFFGQSVLPVLFRLSLRTFLSSDMGGFGASENRSPWKRHHKAYTYSCKFLEPQDAQNEEDVTYLVIVVKQTSPTTEEATFPTEGREVLVFQLGWLKHVIVVVFSCKVYRIKFRVSENGMKKKFELHRWWMEFLPCGFAAFGSFLPLFFFLDANASKTWHGRKTKSMSMHMQQWHLWSRHLTWKHTGVHSIKLNVKSAIVYQQMGENDSDLHARSPSAPLTVSPLILAASSSAKDDGPVF